MSFRRSCGRSSALFGLVAACVASRRVFLSLSARSSAGVKKSLVGSISALFLSAAVRKWRELCTLGGSGVALPYFGACVWGRIYPNPPA